MNRFQRLLLVFACILLPVTLVTWLSNRGQKKAALVSPSPPPQTSVAPSPVVTASEAVTSTTASPTPKPTSQASLVDPVADFKSRITKKFFGTYVTPSNSPVQPERFMGYHTGVDAEYADKPNEEIPVHAIAPGQVVLSRYASGYGGVMVIRHTINDQSILVVYGHLAPSSLAPTGTKVSSGDVIGHLGQGGTAETDGERKHLHFAMLKGANIDLRGYVQNKSDLSDWYDPLTFYK